MRAPGRIDGAARDDALPPLRVVEPERDRRIGDRGVDRQVAVDDDGVTVRFDGHQRAGAAPRQRHLRIDRVAPRGAVGVGTERNRNASLRRAHHDALAHMTDCLDIGGQQVDAAHQRQRLRRAGRVARLGQFAQAACGLAGGGVGAVQDVARVGEHLARLDVAGLDAGFAPREPGRQQRGGEHGRREQRVDGVFAHLNDSSRNARSAAHAFNRPAGAGTGCGCRARRGAGRPRPRSCPACRTESPARSRPRACAGTAPVRGSRRLRRSAATPAYGAISMMWLTTWLVGAPVPIDSMKERSIFRKSRSSDSR
jgi:hypothetical protein